jgi:hypothetical protein
VKVIRLIIVWLLSLSTYVVTAILLVTMILIAIGAYFLETGYYKDYLPHLPLEPTVILPSNCLRC